MSDALRMWTVYRSPSGQMIIGLTAHQTLQLIARLQAHADICGRAIAEGKGGNRFPEKAP